MIANYKTIPLTPTFLRFFAGSIGYAASLLAADIDCSLGDASKFNMNPHKLKLESHIDNVARRACAVHY